MPSKQTVLQVGATGYTGQMIAKPWLPLSNSWVPLSFYHQSKYADALHCIQQVVKALVHPTLLSKPKTKQLEALGAEIIPGDIITSTVQDLEKALQGIDISVLYLLSQKLASQDFIVENSIPHIFILVGWWTSCLSTPIWWQQQRVYWCR